MGHCVILLIQFLFCRGYAIDCFFICPHIHFSQLSTQHCNSQPRPDLVAMSHIYRFGSDSQKLLLNPSRLSLSDEIARQPLLACLMRDDDNEKNNRQFKSAQKINRYDLTVLSVTLFSVNLFIYLLIFSISGHDVYFIYFFYFFLGLLHNTFFNVTSCTILLNAYIFFSLLLSL